jgi:hypothetical protein
MDWNSSPDSLVGVSSNNNDDAEGAVAALDLYHRNSTYDSSKGELALQVAALCDELGIEGSHAQITAAFLASGATIHEVIWDTDVALLHKELFKITALPPSVRVKIINLVTERRHSLAPLPQHIVSMIIPPLL